METMLPIIGIIIFILVCLTFLQVTKPKYNYLSRKNLLTKAELNFYKSLKTFIPDNYSIMCKVRLADIVSSDDYGKKKMYGFNKIKSKHIDFIIIDNDTSEIKYAIELNDRTHLLPKRILRDQFIEELFKNSRIKFITISVKYSYSRDDFRFLLV